jgi:type II secretory pathway pseudopilin PulG
MIVLILGVIGLSVANRSAGGSDGAAAKRQYDRGVTCADAAREYLMAKFSASGMAPETLTLNQKVNDQNFYTGHYDKLNVQSVVVDSHASPSNNQGISDQVNMIGENTRKHVISGSATAQRGGTAYRMTVICEGPAPVGGGKRNQTEVEYLVRFGL